MIPLFILITNCGKKGTSYKKSIMDLHICKDSITSKSESDSCDCGPEYYCSYICPEDISHSVSTLISWQHFPRSTSSRSRCDDSEEIYKSVSETTALISEKEEKKSSKSSSTNYPITKSFSQLKALHYLEVRHVFEFLNFLISHLVCNEPEDPVEFLVNLVEKCLRFRDSFGEPPQLFTHSHVQSLYNAFDPFERGYLTLHQYAEAMRTLGLENSITPYNKEPQLNEDGGVEENDFMLEAERCLTENLKQMLRIPKIWEENRLLWKKRMAKLRAKKEFEGKNDNLDEETEEFYCRCSKTVTNYCMCSQKQKIGHEPEQLFLDCTL